MLNYQKSSRKLWQVVLSSTKITIAFHKEVKPNFKLKCDNEIISCNWKSTNGKKYSFVWYCVFEKPMGENFTEINLLYEDNSYQLKKFNSSNTWVCKEEKVNENHTSLKIKEQLENYKELSKMEPSNKWAKLASVFIMTNFDPSTDEYSKIIEIWNNLLKIDPYRINYYKDMRKYIHFFISSDKFNI